MPQRTCTLPECERKYRANGYCDMHRQRLAKYGDPRMTRSTPSSLTAEQRFMTHVTVVGGCWIWDGWLNDDGYGDFWHEGRNHRAHRWALQHLAGVALAPDDVARHTCDTPACVNPTHLLAGTQQQNRQDAVDRGRVPLGEEHHQHRLTDNAVRDIRSSPLSERALARAYGVSNGTIHKARTHQTWRHVA